MARDLELLRAAEEGRIGARVYGWDSVWVTLGRFQKPEDALVDPANTSWIVRPTGGAAVLHGHDVTVGLAFPLRRSVRGSYRIAARPLIEALCAAGSPVVLSEERGEPETGAKSADCFAIAAANDLVNPSTGHKICGCALRRTVSAVLLQASIPVRAPLVEPCSVIKSAGGAFHLSLELEAFMDAFREAIIANLAES